MPFEQDAGVCAGCRRQPFPFYRAQAALVYGGSVTQALLRFKHGGHRCFAVPLARYLAPAISSLWQQSDVVCPVPLHPRRLRSRGFNQALELLRGAGRGFPRQQREKIVYGALCRTLDTPALGHGTPVARAQAVAGAFMVSTRSSLVGKQILVVDDVMTTGATLAECARTLLAGGAAKVAVAALARAI
jgi:predicted amidophosphoribosyltransferase